MKRMIYIVIGVVVLLPIVLLASLSAFSTRPDNLGVKEGRLAPCPPSPNCVSTQAQQNRDEQHGMPAIACSGSPESAVAAIKVALVEMPRLSVVAESENYLHAEATSLIFRFVDDVEFFVDKKNGLIHFRSASRVGRSDLGANRSRMQRFRKVFERESE